MSKESLQNTAEAIIALNNAIEDFIYCLALDRDIVCRLGLDFCCYPDDNEIFYSLFVSERCSKSFMKRVNTLYPDICADEFLWSLLHEVGHLVINDDITDEEWEMILRIKAIPDLADEVYYELTDEFMATEWAANFMREHKELVAEHWENIHNAIMRIYELNEVS